MITFRHFISEALATARTYVKSGKLTQEQFRTIYNMDKTQSKKYVDWVSIQVVKNKFDLIPNKIKLETALEVYEDLTSRGLLKSSIDELKSVKELNDLIGAHKDVTSKREVLNQDLLGNELKGFTKGKDYSIVHNDSKSIIYAIYNHELSCVVGKDSGWCTTMIASPEQFTNYTKYGSEFFYLIDKHIRSSGHSHEKGQVKDIDYSKPHSYDMFAIHKQPNGKIVVTDKADKDDRVTWNEIKNKYNLNDKIFDK